MDVARYLDSGWRWWWLRILGCLFSIAVVALAFNEVCAGRAFPRDAAVYETSAAARADSLTPVNIVAVARLSESKTGAAAPGVRLSSSEGA